MTFAVSTHLPTLPPACEVQPRQLRPAQFLDSFFMLMKGMLFLMEGVIDEVHWVKGKGKMSKFCSAFFPLCSNSSHVLKDIDGDF